MYGLWVFSLYTFDLTTVFCHISPHPSQVLNGYSAMNRDGNCQNIQFEFDWLKHG